MAQVYAIRVQGHLGREWTEWFEGLAITLEANGDTLLTGPVVDQAALHGVLRRVRDVGLPLLSVIRLNPGQADASAPQHEIGAGNIEHDVCDRARQAFKHRNPTVGGIDHDS